MTTESGTVESLSALEATPEGKYQRWSDEIRFAEKELKKFHERANKVVMRYIDERDAVNVSQKWFNIFNANVGIMEASLYANIPNADVSRKFIDMDDDVARVAGTVLQRCIQQDMSEPECDFDQVMRNCVSDLLITGLGTAWLRLETATELLPASTEDGDPMERISHQNVCVDYVYWEDFLWSPCRVWAERRWVARRVPMTRDQLVKRFGDAGKTLPLDYAPKSSINDVGKANGIMKRAAVYEIWDRESKQVIWFCKGMVSLLGTKDDPLGLSEHFEPCPKPLFSNLTTSSCVPKPDFVILQDQYNELDEVNNRISLMIIACKVTGVYDSSANGVQKMLTEGSDNTLVPVDNWAMFSEKGGIKGQIDYLPLDMVVNALNQLDNHRERIKGQIYELTGINDIVRGNTKASETLGAQQIKAKFASVRIQKRQDEVTRFGEEILQIKAEMICKHFDPMVIAQMSNIMNTPDAPLAQQAIQLLKGNEDAMEWRVTIGSDTMAIIDYNQQKQERTEFMNAVATFLQSAATVGQNSPQLVPMMAQLLKFGVAGFRVGKDIEGVIDKAVSEMEQQIEQAKNAPPKPDPEQQKMQMEMQMKQADAQLKQQGSQSELQMKQVDAQLKQQESQSDLQMKQAEFTVQRQQDQQEFALKMQQMQQEFELKMQIMIQEAHLKLDLEKQKAKAKTTQGVIDNAEV